MKSWRCFTNWQNGGSTMVFQAQALRKQRKSPALDYCRELYDNTTLFRKDSDNFRDLYDNTTLFNRDSDEFLWDHWDGIAMFFISRYIKGMLEDRLKAMIKPQCLGPVKTSPLVLFGSHTME